MRIYNITTTVREYKDAPDEIKKDTIILSNHDDIEEHIQMLYGCWYIIIDFEVEEAKLIHISKNYIAQEAMKLIRFD